MSTEKSVSGYDSFEKFSSALIRATVELRQVGKRIEEIRLMAGLTQSQLAVKIAETQNDISRFERGERIPKDPAALIKIADLDPHQRGLRWLLGGDKALHQLLTEREEAREKLQAIVRAAQQVARELAQIAIE